MTEPSTTPLPYKRTRQIMRVVAEALVEGQTERGFALQDAARAAVEALEDELAYAISKDHEAIAADRVVERAIGRQEGAEEADPNADWMTEAHMLCTDWGIGHGRLTERLNALRMKLERELAASEELTRTAQHSLSKVSNELVAANRALSETQSARGRLAHEVDQWRAFAQRLTGVDANDCGWLRAEMESQWRKKEAYAEELREAAERMMLTFRAWMAGPEVKLDEVQAAHIHLRDTLAKRGHEIGPFCCEQGERLGLAGKACPECAETSRAYSAAASPDSENAVVPQLGPIWMPSAPLIEKLASLRERVDAVEPADHAGADDLERIVADLRAIEAELRECHSQDSVRGRIETEALRYLEEACTPAECSLLADRLTAALSDVLAARKLQCCGAGECRTLEESCQNPDNYPEKASMNLSKQSLIEWAAHWVPEANQARFAEALTNELAHWAPAGVTFTAEERDGLDRYRSSLRDLQEPVRHDGLSSAIEKILKAVDRTGSSQYSGDTARLDWLESQVKQYGDGRTEPREASLLVDWSQSRDDPEWPGLRPFIDRAMNTETAQCHPQEPKA